MHRVETQIEQYAELAVRVGVNIQPGQTLFIGGPTGAPIERMDFVRMMAAKAYDAGASRVHVLWEDEWLTRLTLERASKEALRDFPRPLAQWFEEAAAGGAAFLRVSARDPDLLEGVDPQRVTESQRAMMAAMAPYMEYTGAMRVSWSIVCAATKAWANKVFPNLAEPERLDALWRAILQAARVTGSNPASNWREHLDRLSERTDSLNRQCLRKLHYRAPGTDLVVELPERHHWLSCAGSRNTQGTPFVPNMPTEEVFTVPARNGVHGTVKSTMPLNYNGTLIRDLTLRFEEGRIVEYSASSGLETLKGLVETDEGSHYLGEIALVPVDSPISQLGVLFYNTLLDENASCHLAIGRGFPVGIEGGESMSKEELAQHGVNDSIAHVDFMIGSRDLEIDGETEDGPVPIFRSGTWATS
jgi:aminopeptidase